MQARLTEAEKYFRTMIKERQFPPQQFYSLFNTDEASAMRIYHSFDMPDQHLLNTTFVPWAKGKSPEEKTKIYNLYLKLMQQGKPWPPQPKQPIINLKSAFQQKKIITDKTSTQRYPQRIQDPAMDNRLIQQKKTLKSKQQQEKEGLKNTLKSLKSKLTHFQFIQAKKKNQGKDYSMYSNHSRSNLISALKEPPKHKSEIDHLANIYPIITLKTAGITQQYAWYQRKQKYYFSLCWTACFHIYPLAITLHEFMPLLMQNFTQFFVSLRQKDPSNVLSVFESMDSKVNKVFIAFDCLFQNRYEERTDLL